MKKFYSLILLASAVSFLASCQKAEISAPVENSFTTLTISANEAEAKALFNNASDEAGGIVSWHKSDKLVVFDSNDDCRSLTHTEKTGIAQANFTTNDWTGYEPHYAVASKAEENVSFKKTTGKLSVYLNKSQTIMAQNTFSSYAYVSLGRVKKDNDKYSIAKMNQLAGFVKFTLSRTDVAYVVAESIDGEQICGWVDVDTTKFNNNVKDASVDKDFWSLTPETTKETQVVATPTKDLVGGESKPLIFPAGNYYLMLLPGTYSKGIRLTCYDINMTQLSTNTIGATSGLTVERGKRIKISSAIDGEELFPSTVNITLDFTTGNPLGTFVATSKQTANGETYPYAYSETVGGKTYSQNVNFTLFKGVSTAATTASYSYNSTSHYLAFSSNKNAIQLPAIPNRYLKSIKITIENAGYNKAGGIQKCKDYTDPKGTQYVCAFTIPAASSITIPFTTSNNIVLGYGYWIRFTDANAHIYKLELQYAKELPKE